MEALGRIQAIPRAPAVIMISGHGNIETAVRATKLGAFDFIEKPLSLEKVIVLVRNAVQQRRLQDENHVLRSELGHRYQVIGESVPMKALAPADCGDRTDEWPRLDLRRERHRQRTGRARRCMRRACAAKARLWK